jgi:NAD(P)-dependent dehydrogenase (short-subunit alcohol dehydrogenase family)
MIEPKQNKWALVTGGNRGIGFAIAQGLLAVSGLGQNRYGRGICTAIARAGS